VLRTDRYIEQALAWPRAGRHILAHFDEESVVVYQAYRPSIGLFAAEHGFFGGEFRYTRMSWIKSNFLWTMYRSAWGTKPGQEIILALRLRRSFFDQLLARAVLSSYADGAYPTEHAWREALKASSVRLQWDPDRDPAGAPLERRALQLGLRGDVLEAFGKRELLEVEDISAFVAEQRAFSAGGRASELRTPIERVYTPADATILARIGL
jgi:hypothetical protein